MLIHPELAQYLENECGAQLASPPQLSQDAITLNLRNGVTLTVRYAAADAYSLRWTLAEADSGQELGIDTAPLHRDLATFPNHFHDADGKLRADPVTRCDASPQENLAALLKALLHDPKLEQSA